MSLPSYAIYCDHNDTLLYQHFINVGWFLTEDNWIECVQSLPKIYRTSYVEIYNINVPYSWLNNHESDLRELYRKVQEDHRRKYTNLTKKS